MQYHSISVKETDKSKFLEKGRRKNKSTLETQNIEKYEEERERERKSLVADSMMKMNGFEDCSLGNRRKERMLRTQKLQKDFFSI